MLARRALSKTQVQQLLAAVDLNKPFGRRDYLLIFFLFHTGLRVGEASGLNVDMVTRPNGEPREFLDIPAAISKGSRGRVVPLNSAARRCVAKMLEFNRSRGFSVEPEAPFFQHRKHGRLSRRSIQKLVKLYREKSGLDIKVTPHTLRHAFTSKLASSGASVPAIQRILGHRDLKTTQVYTHVLLDELAAAAECTVG